MNLTMAGTGQQSAQTAACPPNRWKKPLLWAASASATVVLLVAVLLLVVHLRSGPNKAQFTVYAASIEDLDVNPSLPTLNCSISVSIRVHNPDSKSATAFAGIRAYATYQGQMLTTETPLDPMYLVEGDTNLVTFHLEGMKMMVPGSILDKLLMDRSTGVVAISVILYGNSKHGDSDARRFNSECSCQIGMRPPNAGLQDGAELCRTAI